MMTWPRVCASLSLLVGTGVCVVGPNHQPPQIPAPSAASLRGTSGPRSTCPGQTSSRFPGSSSFLHVLANQHLGLAHYAQGDYRRAIDCLGQTVASLDGVRRHERFGRVFLPAVYSRAWLARCHAELGMFAEGRALGDEGLRIAEAVDHPASLMRAYRGIGLLALRQGDLRRALPLFERAVDICQDAELPFFFPVMAAALGEVYILAERIADAVSLLMQAMEQTIATEMVRWQALYGLPLGEAQVLAGRFEEAHALAEGALTHAREHQDRGHQAYALRRLGIWSYSTRRRGMPARSRRVCARWVQP